MHVISVSREKRRLGYPAAAGLARRAARAALRAEAVDADCAINIMLTDEAGIHAINLAQRGVDAPTDVLSFPLNELREGEFDAEACEYDYETGRVLLGDMALNLERCAAQAAEYGHSFDRELSYLVVHSVLHLLGYDHLDEGARKRRMRDREETIMEALSLPR